MAELKAKNLVMVGAAAVGAVVGSLSVQGLFNGGGERDFDAALVKMANDLNKTLPMMVDKETRLDSTAAMPGRSFIYRYTLVNVRKDEVDGAEVDAAMRPLLINNYRTQESMKTLREKGVSLHYQYVDKEGVSITEIVIAPKDLTPE